MKRIFTFVVSAIISISLMLGVSCALATDFSEYDYYIEDYDVKLVAQDDRSYRVTETIDVYFNIASHGIYREIPTYSSVEDYEITDVSVENDDYTYNGYGNIRIGNADVEITGAKRYVINYTLTHWADTSEEYDYLYFNIIGTEWDTAIKHVTAEITLPSGMTETQYKITGGRYGSTETPDGVTDSIDGKLIKLECNRTLEPNEGITIDAEMNEGAFPTAVKWMPDYSVDSIGMQVSVDEYGLFTVNERLKITVNTADSYFTRSIDFNYSNYSTGRIGDIFVKRPDGSIMIEDDGVYGFSLAEYVGQTVTSEAKYTVSFPIKTSGAINPMMLNIFSSTKEHPYYNATVSVKSVVSPEQFDLTGFDSAFSVDKDGGNIIVTRTGEIPENSELHAVFTYSPGAFLRHEQKTDIILPVICVICAATVLAAVLVSRRHRPVKSVEFYPPDGFSPAEVGYVIDGNISGRDITSLIYYWASQGHLEIHITGKNSFSLVRKNYLEATHPAYEIKMFNKLFSGGKEKVSGSQLNESFYKTVNKTATAVSASFSGERKVFEKAPMVLARLCGIILPVLLSLVSLLAFITFLPNGGEIVRILFIFIPCCIALNVFCVSLYKNRFTNSRVKKIFKMLFAAAFAFGAMASYMGAFAGGALTVVSAVICLAAILLCVVVPSLTQNRTGYGLSVFGRSLGLRGFLMHAERERLEKLLEADPEYFYNILPYANVLGVSEIWAKKFDAMLKEGATPNWYVNDTSNSFDGLWTAHALLTMNHMTRNMTSAPSSSGGSSGSGWSGGSSGGGFSGGGSSGGGSGGGGGGRW